MFNLKNAFKQIFKDKFIVIGLGIVLAYIIFKQVDLIKIIKDDGDGNCGRTIAQSTKQAYLYVAMFFLWSSYNTHSFYTNKMSEMIFGFRKNINIMHIYAMLLVNLILTVILTTITIFVLGKFDNMDRMFAGFVILSFLLSWFLPAVFMILLGNSLGRIKNGTLFLFILLVILYLVSPAALWVYNTIQGIILLRIPAFFDIIQNNTYDTGSMYPTTAYAYKWIKILGFIVAAMIPIVAKVFNKNKKVIIVILLMLFTSSQIYYFQPDSKTFDYETLMKENIYYYYEMENNNLPSENEEAGFIITDYNIDIDFGRRLKASCEMKISDANCENYKFTLYHTLKVYEVTNATGEKLEYERFADFLNITSKGDCSSITIKYKGTVDHYAANNTYVYLPEDYPYYPIAGYKLVNNDINLGKASNSFKANFFVNMNESGKIYSNLKETSPGHYEGYATGPMFVKGYLETVTIENITYVCPKYPYYPKYYTMENLNKLTKSLKDIENKYGYSSEGKLVLVLDYCGIPYGTGYHFGDDYVDLVYANPLITMRRFEEVFENAQD